jgi:two-component system heavy metal sensor histidine kinase CusS
MLLAGTLISAGLGGLVARSGLKPIHDMAAVAEHITANHLNERIERSHWPEELGRLAGALNRMLGRLEAAFERLSRSNGDLAHELRTPIHNLMGEASVALARERGPEEYRRVLESSLEEYERLAGMINEMLFLARVENPRHYLGRERFNAREEIDAVKEFFEAVSESKGVSVICRGEAEIEADRPLFRRAVTNLLSNSLRHTPSGGTIVLAIEQDTSRAVVVKVIDSGSGIEPDELPLLFERSRSPGRRAAAPGGRNGLGLSIVKSIIELHGGSIAVESARDRGTSIELRFPLSAPA